METEAFSYDNNGNRITETIGSATVNYTHTAGNRIETRDGETYTHDKNGNIISVTTTAGTTAYVYDYDNRLIKATMPDGTLAGYKYDPFGRRIEKNVTANSTTTITRYLYDGLNILAEYDENNNLKTRYTHNLIIDDPLAMERNGNTYYYHKDALGSITAITDSVGQVVQTYEYDAFGNITNQLNPAFIQPFTFTGREYDEESGLYFYRLRTYNPRIGIFMQEDPLGFSAGDYNLFRMVGNSPVNLTDPLGLTWESNWNFFWDWTLGRGSNNRFYGPNDVEAQEMRNSIGVNNLRERFYKEGCKGFRRGGYGTIEAYWDTTVNPFTADWSSTSAQVGGFAGTTVINNGNGTVTFTITNVAGTHSFFLHAVPDRKSSTGSMRNITQTFQWTEPITGN